MNYILETIGKIKDPLERRREAERLLQVFDDPVRPEIPRGYAVFNPFNADVGRLTRQVYERGISFFTELKSFFGDNPPTLFVRLYERFRRNYEHMAKLSEMGLFQIYDLPTHQIFPFFDDFYGSVMQVERVWSDINLKEIKFKPDFIARGGFADIYRVEDQEGRKYALKLFRSMTQMRPISWDLHQKVVRYSLENVYKKRVLFSQKPFTRPRAVTDSRFGGPKWYLSDFFDGDSIGKRLDQDENLASDRVLAGRVLIVYAEMIKKLHSLNALFIDNNWDSVLFNDTDVAICDYDLVTKAEDMANQPFIGIGHLIYWSREHFLRDGINSAQSDLESFALMIDHLLYGKSLLDIENRLYNRRCAEGNRRDYERARELRLTPQLRQVVPCLIRYPRDESITIDDFIAAIKQDFQV
jgi:hypothetical protein